MTLRIIVLLAFVAGVPTTIWSAKPTLRPERLRVEHLENPTTLETRTPRLSWIDSPTSVKVKGASQRAYQLVVASSAAKLEAGQYDIWDSGRVESSDNYLVRYAGAELTDGEDYFWRVRVWDNNGTPSEWSATGRFGIGLIDPTRWQAQWIGAPWQCDAHKKSIDSAKSRRHYPAPLLRRDFEVGSGLVKAKAFVTGLGYFELHLNGAKVGDDLLVPNFTNYNYRPDIDQYNIVIENDFTDTRVMYLAYDVTEMLKEGRNAIGAILGNGFYDCTSGFEVCPFGSPRFLCQLELTYTDGRTEAIVSDTSWQAATSAILSDCPFDGEVYDANAEHPGWDTAGYDASAWLAAAKRRAPDGQLTAHQAPTDRVTETFTPTSLTRNPDGSWDVEYPAEISGWIRLCDMPVSANDTIDIKYHSEQELGQFRYISREAGRVNHAPRFTWYVFSRATISGVDNLRAENLVAEAVNTDLAFSSEFRSSVGLLDSINAIWRRSQLDNMHGGIASDCPHRERAAYTGDGQVAMNVVMDNFDAAAFYRKWMRDMRDAQNRTTGYVPNGAPWQPGCGGGVAWGAAMNVMPWEYYRRYADPEVLAENYPAMKAQVAYMLKWLTPEGTMKAQLANANGPADIPYYWLNLGDWAGPFGNPSDELVHTFYLWRCLDYTARTADVLHLEADAAFYAAKAAEIKTAFHRRFYNPEERSYGDFGSNVFALEMGVPAEHHDDVVATLAAEIGEKYSGHLNTGIFGTRYLFEQLAANGLNDLAYAVITQRDFPSFGYWLAQGATTTWEKWDGKGSHNHPMFGGGLGWMYHTLAGLSADDSEAGFRRLVVRPIPVEGLEEVSYSTMTPQGWASSTFNHNAQGCRLTVTVPVGSTADVYVPVASAGTEVYTEGSSKPQAAETAGGYFMTTVGQGTHTFTTFQ